MFEFWIDDPQSIGSIEPFGHVSENPGNQLERLAEVVGVSSRRKFQEIVKEDALQGFLRGLGKK